MPVVDDPLDFSHHVPDDGYAWWYLDALSDDGKHGLVIIAFIGSVFSPYYARARRQAPADPMQYCALNVALYGGHRRWAMTERTARHVARDARRLQIGPSALTRTPSGLRIELDERCMPWPVPVRGVIEVETAGAPLPAYALDAAGEHLWQPIAPMARVEATLTRPSVQWSGHAYLDSNRGSVPLERSFAGWHWSRARLSDTRSILTYDVDALDGHGALLALDVDAASNVVALPLPARQALPKSRWGIDRVARMAADADVELVRTLEDAPFYARSELRAKHDGRTCSVVHESLSMHRFVAPWVQCMLPFRMPRIGW